MAFLKESRAKGKTYYSICESYRLNGKPRHRLLEYIGDFDELKKYTVKGYYAMHSSEKPISGDANDDPRMDSRPPFDPGESMRI